MSPPTRPLETAKTLVWYAILAGIVQLSPVPKTWKFLPTLETTFLVQGLKNQNSAWRVAPELSTAQLPQLDEHDEEGDAFYNEVGHPLEGTSPHSMTAVSTPAPSASTVRIDATEEPALSARDPECPEPSPGSAPETTQQDETRTLSALASPPAARTASRTKGDPETGKDPLITPRSKGVLTPLTDAWKLEQGCLEPGDPCRKRALDSFFQALERTAKGERGAITRVSHFGDSIVASDFISATVRRRLQKLYGDAGHGFVLAARPWRWYEHRGVSLTADAAWKPHSTLQSRVKDRLFGLGGVALLSDQAGIRTRIGTAQDGHMGRSASQFDLYFLRQPGGGSVRASLNGGPPTLIGTSAQVTQAGFQSFSVPDGKASLELTTVGDGPVRLYGVALERTAPGVVYDSIGMVGGSIRSLRKIQREHWLEQLRHRQPQLVVLSFAANEELSVTLATPRLLKAYEADLTTVLQTLRQALPQSSILIMGPMDMATREGDEIRSRATIPYLREAQRRVALSNGAAFWDTYAVMGGEGAMPRWVKSKAGASDLVHPSWAGAVFLGNELSRSLIETFQRWQQDPQAEAVAQIPEPPVLPERRVQRPGPAFKPPYVPPSERKSLLSVPPTSLAERLAPTVAHTTVAPTHAPGVKLASEKRADNAAKQTPKSGAASTHEHHPETPLQPPDAAPQPTSHPVERRGAP